jgi:hypothetical protein
MGTKAARNISQRLQLQEQRMTSLTEPLNSSGRNAARNAARRGWLLPLGISLATALAIVSPFFWRGSASGHDFEFHAASWLDAAGQWSEGIVYPRWTEWANSGFGEPRFIFYPPLSWMLGAALSFVTAWNALPGVFIVLVQTMAGLSAYALARRLLPSRPALFCAACYAANPYALLVVYMRSDFAEQLATAFFPLLLLLALEVSELLENGGRDMRRSIAFFALVFSCVWLSNAPAAVMASYSMALLFAWAALSKKSLIPLVRGSFALALGLGVASFYILPAAYEQKWVNIAQALSSGLQPAQNFLYTTINDPEHNVFNWIASSMAILLIVVTGIAGMAARKKPVGGNDQKLWRALLLLAATATLLMFRPTALIWMLLPKLRFVQFPWRWMSVLAVPYAYFLGAAIARRRRAWIWIAAVFAFTVSSGAFLVQHTWWDSEDIPALRVAIANDRGFEGTDEYDPAGDDHYSLPANAPRVQILPSEDGEGIRPQPSGSMPAADVRIERWTAYERDVRVNAHEPVRVVLRVLNYPAWRSEVNGKVVTPQLAEGTAQIILPVSAGTQEIRMTFTRTPDRTLGGGISAGAGMVLLALLYLGRRTTVRA